MDSIPNQALRRNLYRDSSGRLFVADPKPRLASTSEILAAFPYNPERDKVAELLASVAGVLSDLDERSRHAAARHLKRLATQAEGGEI